MEDANEEDNSYVAKQSSISSEYTVILLSSP